MAAPASKDTWAIARRCVRIAVAVFIGVASLLTVGGAGILLNSLQSPGQVVASKLEAPWVGNFENAYNAIGAAWDSAPDAGLAVSTKLEPLRRSSKDAGYRQFRISVVITFKSSRNPIIALFRHGLNDAQLQALMFDLGAPQTPYGVLWADPVLTVDGEHAKAEVIGTGAAPVDKSTIISIPAVSRCQQIRNRQTVVVSGGLTLTGFAIDEKEACGSGAWESQSRSGATYRGFAHTSVALTLPKTTGYSDQWTPIVSIGSNENQAARTLWLGLLVSLPIFLASRLIREQPGLTGAGPAIRTARTLKVFACFSVVAAACQALASVPEDLGSLLGALNLLTSQSGNSASNFLAPALAVVAVPIVWRSAALREVLNGPTGLGRIALLGTFTITSLVGVTGLSYWSAERFFDSSQMQGNETSLLSDVFSLSWPGLIALGGIVAVLGALFASVTVLLRRPPWRTARVFLMATSAAPVLGLAILIMLAAVDQANYSAENFGYPETPWTFTDWLSGMSGVLGCLAAVAIPASLLGVVATSLPWSKAGSLRARKPDRWFGLRILAVACVGTGTFGLLWIDPSLQLPSGFISANSPLDASSWSQTPFGFAVAVFATSLIFLAGIFVFMVLIRARPPLTMTTMAGAATWLLLLMIAPLGVAGGRVGTAILALITFGAGVSIWTALFRIDAHVLNAAPPPWWRQLRRYRWLRRARPVFALVLAAPVVVYAEGQKFDLYDTMSLSTSIARVLPTMSAILLIVLLRYFGKGCWGADETVGSLSRIRLVACLMATVSLFSPTATTLGFPIAFGLGVVLVFFWLVPNRSFANRHAPIVDLETRTPRGAIEELAGALARVRTTESLARGLRKSIAENSPDITEQKQRIDRIVDVSRSPGVANSLRRQALSSYCGETAWRRAMALGLVGTLVGLPWTILDIAAILSTLSTGGPYRLVDSASALLVFGRFTIAGLVLGAAYPMVRGESGLAKGLSLAATMTAPALVITLLPTPTMDSLAAAGLQALQWVIFGLVLGLVADWQAFHRFGYGWRNVRELHRMTAFTASVSTIVVAVLTASATTLGTGATQVFLDRVLPPPPSVSQSQSAPSSRG